MTSLTVPDVRLHETWAETVREFGAETMHGSGHWDVPGELLADPGRSACEQVVRLLARQADMSVPPADDRVHSDYFWITDGEAGTPAETVVGFLALRHALNAFLLEEGGHIGYSVRPSRRREGHASRALALSLVRAAQLGVDPALVTCDEDNLGSRRTIEGAGGDYEDTRKGKRRYWFATGRARAGSDAGPR